MIRPSLLSAYRNTVYQAGGAKVRVGRRCSAMDRLLLEHRARQAAFISAYNPFSRLMQAGWNHRMQKRLGETVRRRTVLPATGCWRRWSEAHFLVLGDPRLVARLARRFRQNAIVIIRLRQPAQLLISSE
ncbi:MAG TPA: DUF3293 domain-containing protein [Acetobacteraceae bacterium]|nr:DUF3293 domain-containing protein [Acetobacteraceae bacterium]